MASRSKHSYNVYKAWNWNYLEYLKKHQNCPEKNDQKHFSVLVLTRLLNASILRCGLIVVIANENTVDLACPIFQS